MGRNKRNKVSQNSGQSQAIIKINDIFDEMREENKNLKNEFLFANKCLLVLEKIKSFYEKYFNECECYSKPLNDSKLIEFNNEYKLLNEQKNKQLFNNIDNESESYESFECDFNESFHGSEDEEKKFDISFLEENDEKDKCLAISERIEFSLFKSDANDREQQLLDTRKMNLIEMEAITDPNYSDPDYNPYEDEDDGKDYGVRKKYKSNGDESEYKRKCNKHKCDFDDCDFKTDKRIRLNKHIEKHNQLILFGCKIKGCKARKALKDFKTAEALNFHNSYSHGIKDSFVCDFENCKFSVRNEFKFKVHQRRHHLGDEKPYHCEVDGCEMKFRKSDTFKDHMTRHSGVLPFKCDWPGCEAAFFKKSRLNLHINTNHLGIKNFACDWPECTVKFAQMAQLGRHKLLHLGVKEFTCEWPGCETKFATNSQLRRHKMIHLGLKPFICNECGKCFNQKINLKTHITNIHLKKLLKSS